MLCPWKLQDKLIIFLTLEIMVEVIMRIIIRTQFKHHQSIQITRRWFLKYSRNTVSMKCKAPKRTTRSWVNMISIFHLILVSRPDEVDQQNNLEEIKKRVKESHNWEETQIKYKSTYRRFKIQLLRSTITANTNPERIKFMKITYLMTQTMKPVAAASLTSHLKMTVFKPLVLLNPIQFSKIISPCLQISWTPTK